MGDLNKRLRRRGRTIFPELDITQGHFIHLAVTLNTGLSPEFFFHYRPPPATHFPGSRCI